ncbi:hypothetical protein HK100_000800 [Physocladia obscura]|uniref:Carboxypeptidase n=1 Tax=Physocladia obscura TaxID=109957 RepID=A0AAD5SZK9_9FUNG|nr:hypothetical protein HK100_000800 [Physocladia obscura]
MDHVLSVLMEYCPYRIAKSSIEPFCINHSSENEKTREICPLCHTPIAAKMLDKHTRKCNAKPPEYMPDFFKLDANVGSVVTQTTEGHLRDLSDLQRTQFFAKVKKAYKMAISLEDGIAEIFDSSEKKRKEPEPEASKNHTQVNALVDRLKSSTLNSLSSKFCYLEFGCGTAELSQKVNEEIIIMDNSRPQFVLIDRGASRWKVKNERGRFEKLRIDIKDLVLSGCEPLKKEDFTGIVCISKHLCGSATDLTLRFEEFQDFRTGMNHFTGLNLKIRRELGRMSKSILNAARVEFLRKKLNMQISRVRKYVDQEVTPENLVLEGVDENRSGPRIQTATVVTAGGISAVTTTDSGTRTPLPFLGAATVSGDSLVLGVQTTSVSIYSLPSSTSIPPNLTDPENSDTLSSQSQSQSESSNGFVYAAIQSSQEISKKLEGKTLWVWALGKNAKKAQIDGKGLAGGPGKPDWTKTMDHIIQHISPHGSKGLIVFHKNTAIALMKFDLSFSLATHKAKGSSNSVIWTQTRSIFDGNENYVTESANVIKISSKEGASTYVIRTVRIETKFDVKKKEDVNSILVHENPLKFPESNSTPIYFCFGEEQKLFIALSSSEVYSFNIKSKSFETVIRLAPLHLSCFTNSNQNFVQLPFAMQFIGKSYLAIVGVSEKNGNAQNLLSIWDTRYGTMQIKHNLNGDISNTNELTDPTNIVLKEPYFGRTFHIESAISLVAGSVICITTSNLNSKPSKNSVAFSSSISLVPFYCPAVSLMAAFGKLSNSMLFNLQSNSQNHLSLPGLATVAQISPPTNVKLLKSWVTGLTKLDELDASYVSKLTSSNLSVDETNLELVRWIFEKTKLTSPKKATHSFQQLNGVESLVTLNWITLPIIEISQPAMIKLLSRCFSNVKSFYPVKTIQYLISSGRVPACFLMPGSDDTPDRSVSIIECCLAKDDLPTLCQALKKLVGLNEYDIIQVVKYVCCVEGDLTGGIRRATIDNYVGNIMKNKKKDTYRRFMDTSSFNDRSNSSTKHKLDGRKWFFECVFSIPQQNDFAFGQAVKHLTVDEVAVVVEWAVNLLEIDLRRDNELLNRKAMLEARKVAADQAADANGAVGVVKREVGTFFETIEADDLEAIANMKDLRRQLWWLWETPGTMNEFSDVVSQVIDVVNLIVDMHLTMILLTPSLQNLLLRLKECVELDLKMFSVLERRLNGCLAVFELPAGGKKQIETEAKKEKKPESSGLELRQRWKRMVSQVNDGVGGYAKNIFTLPQVATHSVHLHERIAGDVDWCNDNVEKITGYFETPHGYFFFAMFESRNDPENDPFVLWINGGPGCSSNLGLFMELGPCRVDPGGNSTSFNPYGWNNKANLLFLDQPVGTGFSYAKPDGEVGDSETAAADFSLFGESYAGHYIPAIGRKIFRENANAPQKNPNRIHIELKSLGIGNGWVRPLIQYNYFADFLIDSKYGPFISISEYKAYKQKYQICKFLAERCERHPSQTSCIPANLYCGQVFEFPAKIERNPYDVRKPCIGDDLCYEIETDLVEYLNRKWVQQAIGVNTVYKGCSNNVSIQFLWTGDLEHRYDDAIAEILDAGVRVLIYAGDADFVCNWIGNIAWLTEMEWNGSAGFQAAPDQDFLVGNDEIVGKFRTFGNLTWVKIFDAGHMVPYDKPAASLEMLNNWILN